MAPFDLVVPITTGNGKTIWHKIGSVFKNEKEDKRHLMTISIRSIPLKAYVDGEIMAYVFPPREEKDNVPPISNYEFDDVPY